MSLLFPELLLLIVPLLLVYYWRARTRALGGAVRIIVLTIIALIAAVPHAPLGGKGADVIVVVDMSRSMPGDARTRALEIVKLLEQQRETGDRVGVVTYGREPRIERLPEEFGELATFVQEVDRDGSDLGAALGLAASLIPRARPGRIIVLSDGEANGAPVASAAHDASLRGLPVDFRLFARGETADVAVASLDLPGSVDEREPFQFTASVRTDRTVDSEAVLYRDGVEIARLSRTFEPGVTQLVFRDLLERPGLAHYRLELNAAADRVPENNRGDAAVRVEAPPSILLVNASGQPDNLSRALSAGRLRVATATPARMPKDLAGLVAYRAVILENVPASQVGPDTLAALSRFSSDLGGGLLVTGGGASFGLGGYFKSPLDPYLPVSMEIKNEHRKLSLAMAVVLDRSGSMAMSAGDGRTKMDLANLGTCAAMETLGPFDEIGVIAVDSAAHLIVPLTSASDKDRICDEVRRIQSMGGGIFTYTALVSAARMVQESDKGTRHIVLFADAADAEEPGEYQRLLSTLTPLGITVSVIGLGQETDADAELLKDIATRGGGRISFASTADDLPRLFAQEAITVARSSFVTEATNTRTLPDLVLLGELPTSAFPSLDGYNLTYLRPGATMGAVTTDEYEAPVLAFWHRGLGRVAALTTEADGQYARRLNAWPGFQGFAVGLGRWLLGGDPPSGVRAAIEREGGQGIVRVELDPERPRGTAADVRVATASVVQPEDGSGSAPERLTLSWVGEHTLEARFALTKAGVYLGAVQLPGGDVLPLPPLSLPYSPEYEPREDPKAGETLLRELARTTGGSERVAWDGVFDAGRFQHRQLRDLVLPLTLALLLLHVVEIAGRRLLLFPAASAWLRGVVRRPLTWPGTLAGWTRARRPPRVAPAPAAPSGPAASADASPSSPAATAAPPPPPATPDLLVSPLARAKAKAQSRLGGSPKER